MAAALPCVSQFPATFFSLLVHGPDHQSCFLAFFVATGRLSARGRMDQRSACIGLQEFRLPAAAVTAAPLPWIALWSARGLLLGRLSLSPLAPCRFAPGEAAQKVHGTCRPKFARPAERRN